MKFKLKYVVLITFISANHSAFSAEPVFTSIERIYSEAVNDSFDIFITLPASYDSSKNYDVVYYLDARLKSGVEIRKLYQDTTFIAKTQHTILVGIGHIGHYRTLRRRDFIAPKNSGQDTSSYSVNFGQASRFYEFLQVELMPLINNRYRTTGINSIMGHSLGGHFVLFCLFEHPSAFDNYFALSPSLWIDNFNIMKYFPDSTLFNTTTSLYVSAGSKERLNRILKGTDMLDEKIKSRQVDLNYTYCIHKGESHNSQVKPSLIYLFSQ